MIIFLIFFGILLLLAPMLIVTYLMIYGAFKLFDFLGIE